MWYGMQCASIQLFLITTIVPIIDFTVNAVYKKIGVTVAAPRSTFRFGSFLLSYKILSVIYYLYLRINNLATLHQAGDTCVWVEVVGTQPKLVKPIQFSVSAVVASYFAVVLRYHVTRKMQSNIEQRYALKLRKVYGDAALSSA